MRLVVDLETNSKHDHIWFAVSRNMESGEVLCHTSPETLKPLIERSERVIAHNGIGFDFYLLEKLWKLSIPQEKMTDTLILSKLYRPDLEGGHSLDSWGFKLGLKKGSYVADYKKRKGSDYFDKAEWDDPDLPEMEEYCKLDVELTEKLYRYLEDQMGMLKFSPESIQLEHDVAYIIKKQEIAGVAVDERAMMLLKAELDSALAALEKELVETFEPTIVKMKTKTKIIPFNPGSRQQISARLQARGWKPDKETEKGNVVVDEEVLDGIDIPEAKLLARYFMLQKRVSQIAQWVKFLKDDGRIHGRVDSIGAITCRMTHNSPNMAQVPANDKPYGRECRSLFIAPKGKVLVGVDASGLELRMLAHYMADPEYTKEVCEGDIHTKNQTAARLQTRAQAKTFIYAFLYGAGPGKIGSIVSGGVKEGKKLINSFLSATPALAKLKEKVARLSVNGHLPGLDGRRIRVRSEHAALNTLLQGAGAILMKVALVLLYRALTEGGYRATIVLNIHDEWQIEVDEDQADEVGRIAVKAIEDAGVKLGLRCPVTGSYHVGRSWAETH